MRVAIFTDNDFDKINGVTTTLKALLRHAPDDVSPRVYTFADFGIETPEYLALASIGVPIPFYGEMQMYIPRLRELRRRLRADGVRLIHLTTPGPAGLAARYLARRGGTRLVGSFHTLLAEYVAALSGSTRLADGMRHYMRWLYGACEQVLVPSRDTYARLVADRWNAERMSVWPRGVDTVMFSPSRRSAALREQWHVCDRRRAVLYAGRLSREKGLALLRPLETLLHQRRVPFRLVIVGEGPMTPELRELCPDAVFTGRLSHDQVAVAMASADAFVFPSETDTAGNVVLEAQASGLPVIVTSAGGPQENMRHGETGFVCAPKDAHGVAQRLAELLRDDGYRTGMGAAARLYAQGRSWAASLQPVFDLYRTAIQTPAAAGDVPSALSRQPGAPSAA